ncbi:MAG: DNA repair protein RadC [Acetatifactor sp.]|nr:DNA repair protein RadC [Acetatifactor sp.]
MKKEFTQNVLPYERFLEFGAEYLTDAELLAIILRTGTVDCNALMLADKVLALSKYPREGLLGLYDISLKDLTSIKGIGEVKAVKLKCIAELSMRMSRASAKQSFCFNEPSSVAAYYMEKLRHRTTECVFLLCLDSKGKILSEKKMSEGSVKMSLISPREIFMEALKAEAVNLILLHNHPSGDPMPSNSDLEITKSIKEMGLVLDIPLLDHIIIGDNKYLSFREASYL